MQRVIAHVDIDCFYVMVEIGLKPELRGKPCAVVQYNTFGSLETVSFYSEKRYNNKSCGGIIAVSYEAREKGVKRCMNAKEARKICPEIELVTVPTAHGKADLTIYRQAGTRIVQILSRIGPVERASVDEAYIDVTKKAAEMLENVLVGKSCSWSNVVSKACNSKVAGIGDEKEAELSRDEMRLGHAGISSDVETNNVVEKCSDILLTANEWWARPLEEWTKDEMLLACGAVVLDYIRKAVTDELGYTCSAGIAPNKLLAKLAAGLHKPNKQTVVPPNQISKLMMDLPLGRIRGLGGKLGKQVAKLFGITTVGQLTSIPYNILKHHFDEKTASTLFDMVRGIDLQPVSERALSKSLVCGKTFRGSNCLRSTDKVKYWLSELATELQERLDGRQFEDKRKARRLVVQFLPVSNDESIGSISRSCELRESVQFIAADAFNQVLKWINEQKSWGIGTLYLFAENFSAVSNVAPISKFFKKDETFNTSTEEIFSNFTKNQENGNNPVENIGHAEERTIQAKSEDDENFVTTNWIEENHIYSERCYLSENDNLSCSDDSCENEFDILDELNESSLKFSALKSSDNPKFGNISPEEVRSKSVLSNSIGQKRTSPTSPESRSTNCLSCPICGNSMLLDHFESHLAGNSACSIDSEVFAELPFDIRKDLEQEIQRARALCTERKVKLRQSRSSIDQYFTPKIIDERVLESRNSRADTRSAKKYKKGSIMHFLVPKSTDS